MKLVLVLAVVCAGCATVHSVCPPGTRLVTQGAPILRARYCTNQTSTMAQVGTPGRTFISALGIGDPTQMSAGVEGPFTRWHDNGKLAASGTYVDLGGRSVPDGIWAFWHPGGQRAVLGRFREGAPVGCFAHWDEQGQLSVGIVEDGTLREVACVPPSLDTFTTIEQQANDKPTTPRGDLTLFGFAGGGDFGARNAGQFYAEPSLLAAIGGTARVRVGPIRFGPTGSYRIADTSGTRSTSFGANIALGLRSPHPRLDLEVALELGAQRISAFAARASVPGTSRLEFWSPLGAAELGASLALSDTIALRAALRLDGAPTRDVDRDVSYCIQAGCFAPVRETWQLGGFTYGATLGFRFVL